MEDFLLESANSIMLEGKILMIQFYLDLVFPETNEEVSKILKL